MNFTIIGITIIFVSIFSKLLMFFENKSNFPNYITIPLIVAPLTKYIIGDWDTGYRWSYMDILYWTTIFTISFLITKFT